MVFCTGKREYQVVREVFSGGINDVYVCRERDDLAAPYKTVWIVRDRKVVRALMGSLDGVCEEYFMHHEDAGFVFPYRQERPLPRFYPGNIREDPDMRWQIWTALVVACMTVPLSPPLLKLVLDQDEIHLGADGTVWFGTFIDLEPYDGHVTERDNAAACAEKIAGLLRLEQETGADRTEKQQALRLLEKKLSRKGYREFITLYKDIRLIGSKDARKGWRTAWRERICSWQDRAYRLLSWACILLVCMAAFVLVADLFFGDAPFRRLFGGPVERIGTESLLQ